ncbi:hypothetical protein OF83DRAFT_1049666, partial [Amylostereum chailletii]
PSPPTLREILGAYRTRGDGDREMLLAMLSAKSAEDQVCIHPSALFWTVLTILSADRLRGLPSSIHA